MSVACPLCATRATPWGLLGGLKIPLEKDGIKNIIFFFLMFEIFPLPSFPRVAALDGIYSQLPVEDQRNIYTGIKHFLSQDGKGDDFPGI